MAEITRRSALQLVACAASLVAMPPLASGILPETVTAPHPALLKSWAVGTSGDWNWQVIHANTAEEAMARFTCDATGEDKCFCDAEEPEGSEERCEFCETMNSLEVDRKPEWDGKRVMAGDATWFASGLGANCHRCSYETFHQDDGRVVGDEVVCDDCMTMADWQVVDPEHAAMLRLDHAEEARPRQGSET